MECDMSSLSTSMTYSTLSLGDEIPISKIVHYVQEQLPIWSWVSGCATSRRAARVVQCWHEQSNATQSRENLKQITRIFVDRYRYQRQTIDERNFIRNHIRVFGEIFYLSCFSIFTVSISSNYSNRESVVTWTISIVTRTIDFQYWQREYQNAALGLAFNASQMLKSVQIFLGDACIERPLLLIFTRRKSYIANLLDRQAQTHIRIVEVPE